MSKTSEPLSVVDVSITWIIDFAQKKMIRYPVFFHNTRRFCRYTFLQVLPERLLFFFTKSQWMTVSSQLSTRIWKKSQKIRRELQPYNGCFKSLNKSLISSGAWGLLCAVVYKSIFDVSKWQKGMAINKIYFIPSGLHYQRQNLMITNRSLYWCVQHIRHYCKPNNI